MSKLQFELGLKTDPIEYRYSFGWLFELMARHEVRLAQLGSFFEIYQLPDTFFRQLREEAEGYGIRIASLFTAHRELGGFFRTESGFEQVARKNFERFIEAGAILGADSVGSNPGAVLRDQMGQKAQGIRCYVKHMKELMHFAHERGVKWLTIEPMSCLAEPPTLPEEMREMAEELLEYHRSNAATTSNVGYCVDIAHGYADANQKVVWDNVQLLDASLPYLYELHLKNTDALFNSTFGFNEQERGKGIVDVAKILDGVQRKASQLPVHRIGAYLEIGGPKVGRDYSDIHLERALTESLSHLRPVIEAANRKSNVGEAAPTTKPLQPTKVPTVIRLTSNEVQVAPSMMCADALRLGDEAERMEKVGVHAFHIDVMDGHFAPNLSMAMPQIEQLAKRGGAPLDVHLMVNDNDHWIHLLAPLKIWQVTVHAESCMHLDRTLGLIKGYGMRAGVALNPHTPPEVFRYVLPHLDSILVMTVNPGFAGQKLTRTAILKISDVRRFLSEKDFRIPIAVDGNVSFENIPSMVAAGASYLVAGTSSLFARDGELPYHVERINAAIAQGLKSRVTNPT